ncbi:MAG: NAD-dependent epimerase/dehydratase family protein [bacterium]
MRILVTGTSGKIGSTIAEYLQSQHEIIGLDLVPGKFTTVYGDIADRVLVSKIMPGVEAIIHTASLHAPHVATHSEAEFIHTNVDGVRVLLDMAQKHGVTRFVYTSTTSVYGDAMVSPHCAVWVTEDLEPQPRDIYDQTKLAAEALCRDASIQHAIHCIVLRMSRCFPEPPHLMASYRLYRGVDARDVAQAHALALFKPEEHYRIYNISALSPFQKEDLETLATNPEIVIQKRCPMMILEFHRRGWPLPQRIDRVYVIDRAQKELGLVPKYGFAEYLVEYDSYSTK